MRKSSAKTVAANQDLLTEILSRLPVKSVFRFKCVSKGWLYLISSPFFGQRHTLKNSYPSPKGLFLNKNSHLIYLSLGIGPCTRSSFGPVSIFNFLNVKPYPAQLTVLSSCNGLLCILSDPPRRNTNFVYYVCNPTTKSSYLLPQLGTTEAHPIITMDLAFDPNESAHYKVVCIRQFNSPNGPNYIIEIFSSETGSWKTCPGPYPNIQTEMQFWGGVYHKGSVHYLYAWGGDQSFYFNIKDETMNTIPVPPVKSEVQTTKRTWFMNHSGGHLHLVDIQTNVTRESSIDIYEIQQDNSGWCLVHRVELSALGAVFPEMVEYIGYPETYNSNYNHNRHRNLVVRYYTCSVLGVVQSDDEDVFELVVSVPKKIGSFDPRNGKGRALMHFIDEKDRIGYEWFNVIQHCETLVPV